MRSLVVAVVVSSSGFARADEPSYPIEIVDRPIVLLPGMTTLDLSEALRTSVATAMDGTMYRSSFFGDRTTTIGAAHAFGPVEVDLSVGKYASAGARLDVAPFAVAVGASFSGLYANGHYSHEQDASLAYKVHVVPEQLALFAEVYAGINERRDIVDGQRVTGTVLFSGVHGTGEVQLTRRLGVYLGATLALPFEKSDARLTNVVTLSTDLTLLFALARWDFFAGAGIGDVTRGHPTTFLSIGFTKRWGI